MKFTFSTTFAANLLLGTFLPTASWWKPQHPSFVFAQEANLRTGVNYPSARRGNVKNNNDGKNNNNNNMVSTNKEATSPFGDEKTARPAQQQDERKLIINGNDADPADYPYHARYLFDLRNFGILSDQPIYFPSCGGTLIAPDIVLSAAHCYQPGRRKTFPPSAVQIGGYIQQMYWGPPGSQMAYFGNDLLAQHYIENNGSETIPVSSVVPHPDFSHNFLFEPGFNNDIMIIQLESSSTKPFIRLNNDHTIPSDGDDFTEDGLHVVGFGDINPFPKNDGSPLSDDPFLQEEPYKSFFEYFDAQGFSDDPDIVNPTVLQDADVSYIPHDDCVNAGNDDFRYNEMSVANDTLCAADFSNYQGTCEGDSGGPLIIKKKGRVEQSGGTTTTMSSSSDDYDIQVGITSFGFSFCGNPAHPSIFTSVSFHYEWIRKQVCILSKDPPSYMDCDSIPILELFEDRLQLCGFGEQDTSHTTTSTTTESAKSYVEYVSICVKHGDHFHNKCVSVTDLESLTLGQEYKSDHVIVDVGCCDGGDIQANGGGALTDADAQYCLNDKPICAPDLPGWEVDETSRSGAVQTILVCIDGMEVSMDPFGEIPSGAYSFGCGSCMMTMGGN